MIMGEKKRLAFVTGATGMMGTHLAKRLVKEGFAVRALVRPTSDTTELSKLGVERVIGDMEDSAETFRKHLTGVTHVFHCAALVDDWADREVMYRINVTGLENLLAGCVGLGLERIVAVSSMAIYGLGRQDNLDETHPLEYSGDNYNYTKIEAEKVCRRFVEEKGLPIVLIRPPYVYGEGDRQFLSRLCATLRDGTFVYLGGGQIPMELVYAGNVVEALFLAGVKEGLKPGEDFIITDGKPVTRREIVETICGVMGYERPKKSAPVWLAKALCPLFELKAKLTGSKKVPRLNRFRLKFMATHLTFNITKAKKLLGYRAVFDPGEALVRSVRWYAEQHPEMAGKK